MLKLFWTIHTWIFWKPSLQSADNKTINTTYMKVFVFLEATISFIILSACQVKRQTFCFIFLTIYLQTTDSRMNFLWHLQEEIFFQKALKIIHSTFEGFLNFSDAKNISLKFTSVQYILKRCSNVWVRMQEYIQKYILHLRATHRHIHTFKHLPCADWSKFSPNISFRYQLAFNIPTHLWRISQNCEANKKSLWKAHKQFSPPPSRSLFRKMLRLCTEMHCINFPSFVFQSTQLCGKLKLCVHEVETGRELQKAAEVSSPNKSWKLQLMSKQLFKSNKTALIISLLQRIKRARRKQTPRRRSCKRCRLRFCPQCRPQSNHQRVPNDARSKEKRTSPTSVSKSAATRFVFVRTSVKSPARLDAPKWLWRSRTTAWLSKLRTTRAARCSYVMSLSTIMSKLASFRWRESREKTPLKRSANTKAENTNWMTSSMMNARRCASVTRPACTARKLNVHQTSDWMSLIHIVWNGCLSRPPFEPSHQNAVRSAWSASTMERANIKDKCSTIGAKFRARSRGATSIAFVRLVESGAVPCARPFPLFPHPRSDAIPNLPSSCPSTRTTTAANNGHAVKLQVSRSFPFNPFLLFRVENLCVGL